MKVPLAKPALGIEEYEAIKPVIESGWLGMGEVVKEFEQAISEFVGGGYCVAVNTGTSALHLALEAASVRGKEVIVPSMTYAATIQAILSAGGIPVFAECRGDDLNLDIGDVYHRISKDTRAIVPVHYGGKPVDMDSLLRIAETKHLIIVEDAAHAFGSSFEGKKVGSFGHLTCFSFDPIKTLTCGEGGAVMTREECWADKMRLQRTLGISKDSWDRYQTKRPWEYQVTEHGFRYHMSNINAAIGLAQLKRIDELIQTRVDTARRYDEAFDGIKGMTPLSRDLSKHVPFCYTIKVFDGMRDEFMRAMQRVGVGVSMLYPLNHKQPVFEKYHASLPLTDHLAEEFVSIPLYSCMPDEEAQYVTDKVKEFFNGLT